MYGWKITWADPKLFEDNEVGTIGPGNISKDIEDKLNNRIFANSNNSSTYRFQMFDDDNFHYFSGILIGDDVDGDEPLIDYGLPYAGCTNLRLIDSEGKESFYG